MKQQFRLQTLMIEFISQSVMRVFLLQIGKIKFFTPVIFLAFLLDIYQVG